MLVNPVAGALVRDPATFARVEPGTEVDETSPYWVRLIIDGDIVAAKSADATVKAPPPPPPPVPVNAAEPDGEASIKGTN